MSGDRRRTPPKGTQTVDERDTYVSKERARSQADTPIEEFDPEVDITKPHEIQDLRYQSDMEILQKRYDMDPAFRALWNMIRRQRRESTRTLGKVADAATTVHQDVTHLVELGKKLEDLATWKNQVDVMLKITKWVLGVVFTIALGSVIVMATKIYTWGVSSGELEIRLQHLERSIERRNSNGYQFPSPAGTAIQPTLPGAKP